jgi:hypothetical protein
MKSNDNQEVRGLGGRVTKNAEMPDYMRNRPNKTRRSRTFWWRASRAYGGKATEKAKEAAEDKEKPHPQEKEESNIPSGENTQTQRLPPRIRFGDKPATTGRSSNKATQRSGIRSEEDEAYQETARERARRKNRAAAA